MNSSSASVCEKKFTQLNSLIQHAVTHVPYYKNLANPHSITELPVITKPIVKQYIEGFVSEENYALHQLVCRQLRDETKYKRDSIEMKISPEIIMEKTSGLSGVPLQCVKTLAERKRIALAQWRQRWCVDSGLRPHEMYLFNHFGQSRAKFDVMDLKPSNVISLYEDLARSRAKWLHAPPRFIKRHLDVLQKVRKNFDFPHLKFLECNGNFLREDDRRLFSEYFDVSVLNQYGTIETWAIALGCPHGYLHVNESNVYVEIIDDDGKVISEMNEVGRVVVTSLHLKVMPFLRYSTGDFAYYEEKRCECPLGGKVLTLIEGREHNILSGVPTRVFGTQVFGLVLIQVYKELEFNDIKYVQIVQEDSNKFILYTNRTTNQQRFLELFIKFTHEALQSDLSKVDVIHVMLDDVEIQRRLWDKPALFISKCKRPNSILVTPE